MRGLLGLLVLAGCGSGEPAGDEATAAVMPQSASAVSSAEAVVVESGPRVLATAAAEARLVTSDGESVYWVDDASHSVMRVALAGGEPKKVATGSAPTALHVAGDDLYFADLEKNEATISKVAKTGGLPFVVWRSRSGASSPSVTALAVWNGGVYFADALSVSKVERGATDSVVSSMAPSPNFTLAPDGLVVAQRSSLRPDMKKGPGVIMRVLPDGKPEPLPSFELSAKAQERETGPLPIAVAADADGVYWMDAAGRPELPVRLMALRKNTVTPVVVASPVSFFPAGLLSYEGNVYWSANACLMKAPKAGGDETLVVRSSSRPLKLDSFTIAAGQLIWADGTRIFTQPIR